MSVKKKTCRICAKEDLHANFVNVFELTVPNVDVSAGDEKISLHEAMKQLTGIKVSFVSFWCILLYVCSCENLSKEDRTLRIETYENILISLTMSETFGISLGFRCG